MRPTPRLLLSRSNTGATTGRGASSGERCNGEDPGWRSPVKLPPIDRTPDGVHREDRSCTVGPLQYIHPRDWGLVELWQAWTVGGGLPFPGSVSEQDAKTIDALQVLGHEVQLLEGYYAAQAEKKAAARR